MPDRELGGYANSNSMGTGGGPSIKEIDIVISPAAGTAGSTTEQTFTVPGVLATDRLITAVPTTGQPEAATTSTAVLLVGGRVSAISVVSLAYFNAATIAGTPTTSMTYAFYIASARVIP